MDKVGRYIPNRLKYFRKLMQYTQLEVARMLGLKSSNRISQWEKGSAMPSVENLLKLSVIYRTLMNELYDDLFQATRQELLQKNEELIGMTLR